MKNSKKMMVAASMVAPLAVLAEGEPGSAQITAAQSALTGMIGLLATAVGAVALSALAIWVIPQVYKWLKRVAKG